MSVFSDFDWSWRGVRVRETGAEIPFSPALALDVWRGGYYTVRELLRRPAPELPITLAYSPRAPRPWYLLWGALRQAGLTRTDGPADLTVYFSDRIYGEPAAPTEITINGQCTDISKSHVAKTFEAVFGYSLSIDPAEATMPFLEKGEENGIHDARIHHAPRAAEPGRVYQKLIDNRTANGTVLDYRCPSIFGALPLVYLKERPVDKRFANFNSRIRLGTPSDYFNAEELAKIKTFCDAMNLDWGGLDILRDAADGRLYIVDVNKTDMGPLNLPIGEKLRAVKILGQTLRDAIEARLL